MTKVSLNHQIEEVQRELKQRERVYPRLITKGTLRQSHADFYVARMTAVLRTLEWLRENEAAIKAKLGGPAP